MSSAVKGARRSLAGLIWVLVIVFGLVAVGGFTGKGTFTPHLALDLAGGREIILQAVTTDGSEIDPSDLQLAVEIIRKRVDASGTSEAEISTRGEKSIIVALPGEPDPETVALVGQSAQLQFRPVLYTESSLSNLTGTTATVSPSADSTTTDPTSPEPSAPAESATDPSPSASAAGGEAHELSRTIGASTAPATPEPSPSASATPSPQPSEEPAVVEPVDASDIAWITEDVYAQFLALDCLDPANLAGVDVGDPAAAFVTCDADGTAKYILGPVELTGSDISRASAGPEFNQAGSTTGRYQVLLEFTGGGGGTFEDVTGRLAQLEDPRNRFGILLDGVVISAPSVERAIAGGEAQITGNFTLKTAQQLANQLKFGAIPLTLEVQSDNTISATKGQDELRKGMLAGLIGLILVVIYSFFQYRALAVVTIGSLVVAGGMTYGIITLLSWGMGYRLSVAGVTGLIVAIGITADSFIVYFERVRDELREGRSLVAAVEHGWSRARRTIFASDAVSFLAAVVLYVLAVGGVRGFAFTLGLTTLVDLAVVILFTHPVLALLARTKFFGEGHRFSGLDPRQLGRDAIYKGRGRVADAAGAVEQGATAPLTLAERKAAARAAATASATDKEI